MNKPDYLYWAKHYFQCLSVNPYASVKVQQAYHRDREVLMWYSLLLQAEYDYDHRINRDRYCEIKATNVKEILDMCERHMKNICMTFNDLHLEGDGTPTDNFYCNMFYNSWADLRDDVVKMLNKRGSRKQTHVL